MSESREKGAKTRIERFDNDFGFIRGSPEPLTVTLTAIPCISVRAGLAFNSSIVSRAAGLQDRHHENHQKHRHGFARSLLDR